jgi:O-methyltransferase involved in polyketide biosynthesis
MKVSSFSISDVSSTLLITLYARARESLNEDPIIKDPKAVEMIEIIKKHIVGSDNPIHKKILKDKYNPKLAVTMSLRSRRFDLYVTDFLSKYPEGTIINLGCGLDTRFYRTDNGKVIWYDIDFPEVIELRKRFMEENSRHFFIGNSILGPEWISKVKTGGPYLILAEGVFMYLTETDVKELLHRIQSELDFAEIVCEVTNRYWVNKMNSSWMKWKFRRQLGMTGGAVFSFGVPDSRYFESWNPKYVFLDEWTYFDDHEKKLGWFNLFSSIGVLRKAQWTVHYSIRNSR